MINPDTTTTDTSPLEGWTTVAVVALPPGWRNVYVDEDRTTSSLPCPALLLQELHYICAEGDDRAQPCGQPYDTRVVAAMFDGADRETVEPAEQSPYFVSTEWRPDDEEQP
jgi:hypothetical protein